MTGMHPSIYRSSLVTLAAAGWGNNELECYTNATPNVAVIADPDAPAGTSNGVLSITAIYNAGQTCYNGVGVA